MYEVGNRINVSDPKHADSIHKHAFVGTIVRITPMIPGAVTLYIVRDAEDRNWAVEFDEIEGLSDV
jgi:hypothetical protein